MTSEGTSLVLRIKGFRKAYARFIKKPTRSIDTIKKISCEEFSMVLKN
jgi:hypothetical protein